MSTKWSRVTYVMVADVLAKWLYPMLNRVYADSDDAEWIKESVRLLTAKFAQVFSDDNERFNEERFVNAINDAGVKWVEALAELQHDPTFQMNYTIAHQANDSTLLLFVMENMIKEKLDNMYPDDKGLNT